MRKAHHDLCYTMQLVSKRYGNNVLIRGTQYYNKFLNLTHIK